MGAIWTQALLYGGTQWPTFTQFTIQHWGSCGVVTTQLPQFSAVWNELGELLCLTTQQLRQYECQHTSAPETSALTTQQQQSCISLRFVHSTTQDPVSAFSTHQSVLNFCSTATRGRSVADVSPAYTPDMELGHWVTGSMGYLGHLSRPGDQVTGSSFWPGVRPEFFQFSKKCPKCKTYIWNAEMASHCQVPDINTLTYLPCRVLDKILDRVLEQ